MRSSQVDEDSFSIISDVGDMIGGAMVFDRKRVEVTASGSYRDFDSLPTDVSPEMREFAEAEAQRLGMLDE